jgi:hypothetical protein
MYLNLPYPSTRGQRRSCSSLGWRTHDQGLCSRSARVISMFRSVVAVKSAKGATIPAGAKIPAFNIDTTELSRAGGWWLRLRSRSRGPFSTTRASGTSGCQAHGARARRARQGAWLPAPGLGLRGKQTPSAWVTSVATGGSMFVSTTTV